MKKYGVVFPGQGSQKIGMGQDLFDTDSTVKDYYKVANEILNTSLDDISFNGPPELLTQTQNAQPAISIVSTALYSHLKNHLTPTCVAGHSLGELTAYHACGILSFEDTIRLIQERGQSMAAAYPSEKSAMAAIMGMEETKLRDLLGPYNDAPLVLANINCPGQIVISGQKETLNEAIPLLKENGAKAIPLKVSGAFHSPLMNSASEHLKSIVEKITFNTPQFPIVLNRTGEEETDTIKLKENVPVQVISSVQWIKSIKTMSQKVDAIIECGPGKVLTGLIKKINPEIEVHTISNLETLKSFIEGEKI